MKCERPGAPILEEGGIAGRIELQQRGPELKPLRPIGPPARLVLPVHGEDRGARRLVPAPIERVDLACGQIEQPIDVRDEIGAVR